MYFLGMELKSSGLVAGPLPAGHLWGASSEALAENLSLVASGSSCGSIHVSYLDWALAVPNTYLGGYPHS